MFVCLIGNVTHIVVPMEAAQGTRMSHPSLDIRLYDNPRIQKGKIGNGILFSGSGQYMTLGDNTRRCMGNLDLCEHGLTVSMYVKPKRWIENSYIMSSGPYSLYYKNGRLHAKFSSSTKTWETAIQDVELDTWQKVEMSWDPDRGLEVYLDGEKKASTTTYRTHSASTSTDNMIYVGGPNSVTYGEFSDVVVDELQVWYANRDHLAAFGLMEPGRSTVDLQMDRSTRYAYICYS